MTLSTQSNFSNPDAAYRRIVEAHRGLGDEHSAALDAALVLILANHIGDIAVLDDAIALAKRRLPAPRACDTTLILQAARISKMAKGFASTTDMGEKKITFSEIGP
ncbi:MAG: DUF2783 domain-containing protein, partial [Pseudorhodoplanes sp.]